MRDRLHPGRTQSSLPGRAHGASRGAVPWPPTAGKQRAVGSPPQSPHATPSRPTPARGFTLVEVLVALVVLSIGLLGLARLQAVSLRQNHGAHLRSQATLLAYDMADRMRANLQALRAGLYHLPTGAEDADCLTTTGCSAAEMAAHDVFEWTAALARALPMGQGAICIDSSPGDGAGPASPACSGTGEVYAIKVWWDDDRTGAAAQRFVVSLAPGA